MASDHPEFPLERLRDTASSLRPIEREVLVLSARERLSIDEIAARLGITTRAAERLLARALRRFDRALERRRSPRWRFSRALRPERSEGTANDDVEPRNLSGPNQLD
jgi:DNA-binding CsgD family transcriptional regulator